MSTVLNAYEYRQHYKETGAIWKLSNHFLRHIPFHEENLSFFCIGTDRSTGDALGPLTGSLLSDSTLFPFSIVGTLQDPLHALNIEERFQSVMDKNPDTTIVAIDACLGRSESVGHLLFQNGPLHPGKAVGKDLPPIGDLSIKGVVNVGGFMEMSVLQSTRLHLSYGMSKVISRALLLSYSRYYNK